MGGYGEPDVELVLGGNFARALGQIWDGRAGPRRSAPGGSR